MALFQSGPYQSKVVGGIVRQSRRLLAWGAIAWRRCRTTASWTAQILLYPVYAVFQASRGLRSRVDLWLVGGSQPIAPEVAMSLSPAEQAALAVDAPVQGILQALRAMRLPISLPVVQDEAIAQSDNIFYPVGPLVLGSRPLPMVIQSGQPAIAPLSPAASGLAAAHLAESPYQVQGIASRLDTRALVLVTAQNQVLDILSHDQQVHLRQRLIWEMATHGRRVQLHQQQARAWLQAYGPIPSQARTLPGRWAQRVLGWMQGSSVAIAANLFQESRLHSSSALIRQQSGARSLMPPSRLTRPQELVIPAAMPPAALSGSAIAAQGLSTIPYPPPTEASGLWTASPQTASRTATPTAPRTSPSTRIPYPPPASGPVGAMPKSPPALPEQDYIDTQASLIQYLRTPLEGCMRWLDRVFVWLETKLAALWPSS